MDTEDPDKDIEPLASFFGLLEVHVDYVVVGGAEGTRKDFLKSVEFWQSHKRLRGGMSILHNVVYFPWQRHKWELSHLLAFDQFGIVVLTLQTQGQTVC